MQWLLIVPIVLCTTGRSCLTSRTPNGVHISIKPQNILLDQELCPKISDVGVANLCLLKESKTSTHVVRERDGYGALHLR